MMLFNTSIAVLLANAQFNQNSIGLNGKYADLTRYWYIDVGNIITTTMFVSIFSPHLLTLLINYPYKKCKRRICYKLYKSQYDLNKLFIGPSFDIANNLSQILTVIFSCYMYSGGIPLLNIFCLLALITNYWANKILLLRYYRKPPVYSADINNRILKFLPFAVILHCIMSLYAFTCPNIFPVDYEIDPNGIYVTYKARSISDRLLSSIGIAYTILIILSIIGFFILLWKIRKYHDMKINKILDQNQIYRNSLKKMHLNDQNIDLWSYDILRNKKYKKLVNAWNDAVRKKRQSNTARKCTNVNNECIEKESELKSNNSSPADLNETPEIKNPNNSIV